MGEVMPRPLPSIVVMLLAAFIATGCVQTKTFTPDKPDATTTGAGSEPAAEAKTAASPRGPVRVVLMPTDIELYELTAGGLLDPKADWSMAANRNVARALEAALRERNATLVDYVEPPAGTDEQRLHVQLIKLHGAVGNTIILHGFTRQVALPTKKDLFDWTLGEDARILREDSGADYALFVYIRDSYTSPGRTAVIVAAALFGVGVSSGIQVGFASLIDLETGDVEWFNALRSETGDLRTAKPASATVDNLLTDIPL